jgi:hypothetical protein
MPQSEQLLRQRLLQDLAYMRNRINEIEDEQQPSDSDFVAGWHLGKQTALVLAISCLERALQADSENS